MIAALPPAADVVVVPGRPRPRSLPQPRGPLTEQLFGALAAHRSPGAPPTATGADPGDVVADDDLQLALYCIHELAYRGLDDVDADAEVDPDVHRWRLALEARFEGALVELTHEAVQHGRHDPIGALRRMSADDGPSLSSELLEAADLDRLREVLVHRSAYQRKEADPHSWAIPRAEGLAKAALIEIQIDEYGSGRPGCSHAELFAGTLRAARLDDRYGAYLDRLPGVTLATTNLISLLGRRRRLLPALLGHLALFEMTSVGPMGRWAELCDRVGLGPEARAFYDVHVVADDHHGPLALHRMVGGHLHDHPDDAAGVVFGAAALGAVESRLTGHLRRCWAEGRSSLRPPDPGRDAGAAARR